MLRELKAEVLQANLALARHGLAPLTFGNVSGIERSRGLVVIKPSGVDYDELTPRDLVVVDLEGKVAEGKLRPSSDTPTHLLLYRAWPKIGGVAHTHSPFAVMFAQARKPIPCLGTTHADFFPGEVPLTRLMRRPETRDQYEANTARVILERFANLDPLLVPGVLVAGHGPFTWAAGPGPAADMSLALEQIARMAAGALLLHPGIGPIPWHLQDKHYSRKHGPGAYYGQTRTGHDRGGARKGKKQGG